MSRFPRIAAKLRSRTALIIIAVALLVLNIGRLVTGQYQDYLAGIDSKRALLGQYQMATRDIDALRQRLELLETKRTTFDSYLFEGGNRDEITSAMQIQVQEMLSAAGLSPESLHPTERRGDEADKQYGEVVIKIRVSGALDQFIQFLAGVYQSRQLFKIDNLTMKPYQKSELKIFFELKGFYKLTDGLGGKG